MCPLSSSSRLQCLCPFPQPSVCARGCVFPQECCFGSLICRDLQAVVVLKDLEVQQEL